MSGGILGCHNSVVINYITAHWAAPHNQESPGSDVNGAEVEKYCFMA